MYETFAHHQSLRSFHFTFMNNFFFILFTHTPVTKIIYKKMQFISLASANTLQ